MENSFLPGPLHLIKLLSKVIRRRTSDVDEGQQANKENYKHSKSNTCSDHGGRYREGGAGSFYSAVTFCSCVVKRKQSQNDWKSQKVKCQTQTAVKKTLFFLTFVKWEREKIESPPSKQCSILSGRDREEPSQSQTKGPNFYSTVVHDPAGQSADRTALCENRPTRSWNTV